MWNYVVVSPSKAAELHDAIALLIPMLKNPDAKEPLFRFIAASCTLNGARSQQWFPHAEGQRIMYEIAPNSGIEPPTQMRTYSHDGMLLNLGATLLQLCDPFTVPNSPHVPPTSRGEAVQKISRVERIWENDRNFGLLGTRSTVLYSTGTGIQ